MINALFDRLAEKPAQAPKVRPPLLATSPPLSGADRTTAHADAVPDFDAALSARWDLEWLSYLQTESIYPHIVPASNLELVGDLRGKSAAETWHLELARNRDFGLGGPLRVWCPGDWLIGAKVLEIGCGCGFASKQIALVSREVLGLDCSRFALTIARATAPSN